jgi:hypothetical protein
MEESMKVKNITPKFLRCAAAGCPAIFEILEENKVLIIGSKADLRKLGLYKRVGKDEEAVIVPKEMLRQIFKK